MARPEGSRNTLIAITYDTIGALAGVAGDTARQYAQRGQFDPRNLDSVLAWVNARRTTKVLPMIGTPDGANQVASYDAPTTDGSPMTLPGLGSLLRYNSYRACFENELDA
jgi:hypothetical protein